MKLAAVLPLCCAALAAGADPGWVIRRVADMPDGAPAFEVISPRGQVTTRIECINNGWYDPDGLAARLLRSTEVMASIRAKNGRLELDDLGPAKFDCVLADERPKPSQKANPK
jgi:porphobilinogen deaminase